MSYKRCKKGDYEYKGNYKYTPLAWIGFLGRCIREKFPEEDIDHCLLGLAESEMRNKLSNKRSEGRGGWYDAELKTEDLEEMLKNHISKGDMVDVMNIAAMLHARKKLEIV